MYIVDAEGEVSTIQFNAADVFVVRKEGEYLKGAFPSIACLILTGLDQGVRANYNEVGMIGHDRNAVRLLIKEPTLAFGHLKPAGGVLIATVVTYWLCYVPFPGRDLVEKKWVFLP